MAEHPLIIEAKRRKPLLRFFIRMLAAGKIADRRITDMRQAVRWLYLLYDFRRQGASGASLRETSLETEVRELLAEIRGKNV